MNRINKNFKNQSDKNSTSKGNSLKQIFQESNLDGIKYITLDGLHILERVFWVAVVFTFIGASVYLFFIVYGKYKANPVIISFQPQETSIAKIPFPAITLCNVNIFKAPRIHEVFKIIAEEMTIPYYEFRERFLMNAAFAEHVAQHCLAAPSLQRLLNATLFAADGTHDYLEDLKTVLEFAKKNETLENDYLLGELYREEIEKFHINASHRCEDMILECMWAEDIIPCERLFSSIHTAHGSCCVFNMMPLSILRKYSAENETDFQENVMKEWEHYQLEDFQEDTMARNKFSFPYRQKSGGKPNGLTILINPELDMYSTCTTNDAWGIKILAHSPTSFPSIRNYGDAVPPDSEVFLEIEPEVITAGYNLKTVETVKRSCYFPDDAQAKLDQYKIYSSANCMDECIAKYTEKNCSCVHPFMPQNSSQKICGAKKLECVELVREKLTSAGNTGFCSKCIPACTEIHYKMRVTNFPIRKDDSFITETKKSRSNHSILHIFLATDSLYVMERKKLYDFSDLISNAGGLLGLTMGFSMVSLLEIIYLFTLRAFIFIQSCLIK